MNGISRRKEYELAFKVGARLNRNFRSAFRDAQRQFGTIQQSTTRMGRNADATSRQYQNMGRTVTRTRAEHQRAMREMQRNQTMFGRAVNVAGRSFTFMRSNMQQGFQSLIRGGQRFQQGMQVHSLESHHHLMRWVAAYPGALDV
ncbi:hypothetical protein [Geomicrobium sp. JCM 19037]|uniref:hypothetical protein n=1 Tax=Geomicrobium sp. JCM 19037 TaxID=1460634 RepID=UPI0005A8870A|nr:hypothetical protein [Geomicrobium sp. JCM 19037]